MASVKKASKVVCIGRNYAYVPISYEVPNSSHVCVPSFAEGHPHDAHSGRYANPAARDHVAELNNVRPKQPFFFLKPTSSILLPGEGPVIQPRGVNLHYEVELALVLGKQVKNLEASDEQGALDAIESKRRQP